MTLVDEQLFRLYLVAAVVLVLAPGPDTLVVLSRSLFGGRRLGWIASLGIASGNVVHAAAAAGGVSAVIAASPWLFDAVRVAGALYLAWLGVASLRGAVRAWREGGDAPLPSLPPVTARRVFTHAFLTNALNPKIILFYLAFVPQFVAPAAGPVALQTFVLGLVLTAMGFVYQASLAALAAGAARRVVGSRRFRAGLDGAAGLLFLGFAARILMTERRYA